jgi:ubiquinone/menaquinone biosynthesis C-methylase UbiE
MVTSNSEASSIPLNPRQLVADGYNVLAQPYLEWSKGPGGGGNGGKDTPLERHFAQFLTLLSQLAEKKSNLQVLELGCGAGVPWTLMVSEALKDKGHLTAIDISDAQIGLATKHLLQSDPPHTNVTLLAQDIMSLQYEPQLFDAVYGLFSLIHLPQQDQRIILAHISKWLKPNGLVFMNFSGNPKSSEDTEVWLDGKTSMYWSSLGLQVYDELLKQIGLAIVVRDVVIQVEDEKDIEFVFYIARKV